MCCNNVVANKFADITLGTAATAGLTVVGSIALGNPITAAGAAIFGAFGYLVGRPVSWICEKIMGVSAPNANTAAKIVGVVGGFFAGTAATWGISTALGVGLSFTGALILSAVTGGIALGIAAIIAIALMAFGCCAARRGIAQAQAQHTPAQHPQQPQHPQNTAQQV
jgi:hypothetical protein